MKSKWMLETMLMLAVCLARNPTSGSRTESVEAGSSMVTLNCTNKQKIAWSEMIYVIWKISVKEKNCYIGVAVNDTDVNTCQDGKIINRTGDYSLIIPHFSIKDEGNYICDVSYHSGSYVEAINVSAWARPSMSGRLEPKGSNTFAVCEVRSLPAASIHWETPWKSSSPKTQLSMDASGAFTVTSWLQMPQNASHKHLTCVAESNSLWPETKLTISTGKDIVMRSSVLLGVCATWPIIKLLISFYIIHRNH